MMLDGIFPVPILSEIADINNEEIEDRCYKLRQSNKGSWQSEFLDFDDPVLYNLVNLVQDKMDETARNLYRFQNEFTIKLMNYWININNNDNETTNNTVAHMHPAPYFFSMVYYVKADKESGPLRLEPPHGHLDYTIPDQIVIDRNHYNARQWSLFPENKLLIGMPSWLKHYADKNQNNNDRISIAFNGAIQRRL